MAHSSADEVDTIVSQAIDLAALEQTAAPSSSSSSLPVDLQTRFHKLKSSMKKPSLLMINEPPHDQTTSPKEPRGPSSSPPSPIMKNPFTSGSYRRSPSPPQPMCCFGRSKRKGRSRKWGLNEEGMLTDPSTFSFKEQQRKLNKARKEEEKASKEAAKVVEWVKQASARMDVSAIEELLSEDELK